MELTEDKDLRVLKHYSHAKEELKKEPITKSDNLSKSLILIPTGQYIGKIDLKTKPTGLGN